MGKGKKSMINIAGIILMVVSIIFLIHRIISLNVNLTDLLSPSNAAIALTISFIGITSIFINSFCWRLCLGLFSNAKIPICETFSVYAKANIMKYLPGNVGHYAGRQLYGAQLGIKQVQLAAATILELAYSTLDMLACAFLFSMGDVIQILRERVSGAALIWIGAAIIFAMLCVGASLFVFQKNEYIQTLAKLFCSARFWKMFFFCILLNSVASITTAVGYVVLLNQYTSLDLHTMFLVLSTNFIAIFAGLITPGVPGGIGVRESVLAAILSPYFPENFVILAAFSQRIAAILADFLAVPVSGLFAARCKKR